MVPDQTFRQIRLEQRLGLLQTGQHGTAQQTLLDMECTPTQ